MSDAVERRVVSVCSPASGPTGEVEQSTTGESVVTLSRSNEIRVEIINKHMLRSIGAFMLQYKGNSNEYSCGT